MRRRAAAFGLLTAPFWPALGALAQDSSRFPKLAILSPATAAQVQTPGHILNMLLAALAELRYVDGENISFEFRFANHALERLPGLAAELVAMQPDVIYTWSSGAGRAVAAATSTIPIVLAPVAEPTMTALVSDMAHPGGNITGLTILNLDRHEKCLQLLKETVPQINRVGILLNPLNPVWDGYPGVLANAAEALRLDLVRVEARGVAELEQAFATMAAQGVDALFGLDDSTLAGAIPQPASLMKLLAAHRLPSISDAQGFGRAGGLLALEPDTADITRGAALYVQRILQGAKVSDLPVVHPATFKLVVNLRTAQQLGITIPPSILLRADEVIE